MESHPQIAGARPRTPQTGCVPEEWFIPCRQNVSLSFGAFEFISSRLNKWLIYTPGVPGECN